MIGDVNSLYVILVSAVYYLVEKFKTLVKSSEKLSKFFDKEWELETAACVIGVLFALVIKLIITLGGVSWLVQQGLPVAPYVNVTWFGYAISGFVAGFLTTTWYKFLKKFIDMFKPAPK